MFTDPDPLEEDMKVRVEDMTPDQLIAYLKKWQKEVNKIDLKLDGKEYWVMIWFQKVYGKADAGRIVKWVCYQHRGKDDRNDIITPRMFNSKMKWWLDKMHIEMQKQIAKDEDKAEGRKKAYAGFATAADL